MLVQSEKVYENEFPLTTKRLVLGTPPSAAAVAAETPRMETCRSGRMAEERMAGQRFIEARFNSQ